MCGNLPKRSATIRRLAMSTTTGFGMKSYDDNAVPPFTLDFTKAPPPTKGKTCDRVALLAGISGRNAVLTARHATCVGTKQQDG
jgi:hypothetical protein